MTGIRFETCERKRALQFLKKLYPSSVIEDTENSAKAVLDMVEKDHFRIPDPDMHGGRVEIFPSTNFKKEDEGKYIKVLSTFHESTKNRY